MPLPIHVHFTNQTRTSYRDLVAASAVGQPQHRAGWFSNLWHLTGRAIKSAYRNAFAIGLRTVMNLFFALLFSAIWHDVRRDQPGIQSLIGLLFMAAANTSFGTGWVFEHIGLCVRVYHAACLILILSPSSTPGNIQATINTFPVEKAVVIKEQASSAYRLSAYFMSKFLSELPLNLLGPALFGSLLYWIVDCALFCRHVPSAYHQLPAHALLYSSIHHTCTYIQTVSHSLPQYGLFLATLSMTALSSVAMGVLLSTAAPTIEVAASLGVRMICGCVHDSVIEQGG